MQLYKISEQIEALWQIVAQALEDETIMAPDGAELTRDQALARLETALKDAEGTHAQKCLDIACLIKNTEAEADAIRIEEKRLAARRKAAESKAEWLRSYLEKNMEPGTNLKDARAVIGWRKSTAVDVLVPADQLPDAFRRLVPATYTADKLAMKEALKTGAPDLQNKAVLLERQNIQIK